MAKISLDFRIENCKTINDALNFVNDFVKNYPDAEIISTKITPQLFIDMDDDDYDDDLDFEEDEEGNEND